MEGQFSVCISVYKNDDCNFLRLAVESVTTKQTIKPSEVILIVDGPVPEEISKTVKFLETEQPNLFKTIWIPENVGLGLALQTGIEISSNEIVMRMDSDDISTPDRFEKQLKHLKEHPDVAVCGGQITEFINDPQNIVGKRICPCSDEAIKQYMKKRCGFNHMTVALRRSKVLEAGNYQSWFWNEDYYLWIRMMLAGCKFANLPDTLVNVRVGKAMYARRGGWKYFKSEKDIQKLMYENHIISWPRYFLNVLLRWGVQVAMPNRLRGWLFQKLLRK